MPTNVPITVSLNVPPLVDNTTWFPNSAAWNNYWAGAGFTANIPAADINNYGVVKAANTTAYVDTGTTPANSATFSSNPSGDGVTFVAVQVPTLDSYNQLLLAHNTLVTNYKAMRTAMVNAGLMNNA